MNSGELILEFLQKLLCLGLEGTPAAELFEGTSREWLDILGRYSPERLSIAFACVKAKASRWPAPSHVIEALPVYEHTYAPMRVCIEPLRIESETMTEEKAIACAARSAQIREMIDACARKLGATTHREALKP